MRNHARWRAATLLGVHVLIAVHIAHWLGAGRSLGPVEVSESLRTLDTGVVTVGAVFMAVAMASAAVFGRFFCGWGCHVLALQDLSAWALRKVGVTPRPVRSRALVLVAPAAMLYLFVWPQVARVVAGRPAPELRLQTDPTGAVFWTADLWEHLPGPWVALATFVVCAFAMVYVLGSRAFCRYACPYGAVFGVMDRFAPGRIVLTGDCTSCGVCTAGCGSDVPVMREVLTLGRVESPGCLKCMDCVSHCPEQALSFSWTTPPLGRPLLAQRPARPDLTGAEEVVLGAAFFVALVVYRGLYGAVPLLLALAWAAILAWFAVLAVRLVTRDTVRLAGSPLKVAGRWTGRGVAFGVAVALLGALTGHSAVVRYHEVAAHRSLARIAASPSEGDLARALVHLQAVDRLALVHAIAVDRRLASVHLLRGEHDQAIARLETVLLREPGDLEARARLALAHRARGVAHAEQGAWDAAARHLVASLALDPGSATTWANLGVARLELGDRADAEAAFRAALEVDPGQVVARSNLGVLLLREGRRDAARAELLRVLERDPGDPAALRHLETLDAP